MNAPRTPAAVRQLADRELVATLEHYEALERRGLALQLTTAEALEWDEADAEAMARDIYHLVRGV